MSLEKHVGVSMSIQCSFWTVLVPASFELSMLLEDGSGEVVSVAVKASYSDGNVYFTSLGSCAGFQNSRMWFESKPLTTRMW